MFLQKDLYTPYAQCAALIILIPICSGPTCANNRIATKGHEQYLFQFGQRRCDEPLEHVLHFGSADEDVQKDADCKGRVQRGDLTCNSEGLIRNDFGRLTKRTRSVKREVQWSAGACEMAWAWEEHQVCGSP